MTIGRPKPQLRGQESRVCSGRGTRGREAGHGTMGRTPPAASARAAPGYPCPHPSPGPLPDSPCPQPQERSSEDAEAGFYFCPQNPLSGSLPCPCPFPHTPSWKQPRPTPHSATGPRNLSIPGHLPQRPHECRPSAFVAMRVSAQRKAGARQSSPVPYEGGTVAPGSPALGRCHQGLFTRPA